MRGALTRQIEVISVEKLAACNQCGKCSAGCPLVAEMDLLPNQVIRLLQLGMAEVLTCETIWTCAASRTTSAISDAKRARIRKIATVGSAFWSTPS